MRTRLLQAIAGLGATVLLAGCGGASHTGNPAGNSAAAPGSPAQAHGAVSFTIKWPPHPVANTSGIQPHLIPAAALSISIVLSENGHTIFQQIASRPTNGATSTATTFSTVPTIPITVTATAYPLDDAAGTALATGSTVVQVTSDTTAHVSLTMRSTVDHLGITPANPSVAIGATTPLTATAYDAAGDVVLTTASKLTWASSDTTKATVDAGSGVVTGVAAGTPTIRVTDSESGKTGSATVSVGASGGSGAGTVQIVGSATLYPTIQAAINAAQSGDTVLVGDGTYTGPGNVDIDFLGKSLTLKSQHGAASTIIDCQGSASSPHRGIYIHSGETSVTIDGFTVKHGYAPTGASDDNSGFGGGAYISSNGPASVTDCAFTDNTASRGGGVQIGSIYGLVSVTNCAFTANTASDYIGGGAIIGSDSGPASVTNCVFTGNTSSFIGGGVYISSNSGTASVTDCAFTGNTASFTGGGVDIDSHSTASVTNCAFTGNTASDYGGGAYISSNGPATVTDCAFTGNTAYNGGGADINSSGTAVTNCILWGDGGGEINFYSGYVPTLTYTDIQGGVPAGVTDGGHNINADPKFVRNPNLTATPPDYGDLHLQPGSPCLGTGATQAEAPSGVTIPTTDLDGKTRPSPPSMGAYD